jgi:hypothetical protein
MTLQRKTPMKRSSFRRKPKTTTKRKRQSTVRQLKAKADRACSRWIREAWDWTCSVCGKQYEEGAQGLHWSHFFSRRHQSIRYAPDNASAKCFSCHQRLGGDPVTFARWIEGWLGSGGLRLLEERKEQKHRWTETELRALLEHIEEDRARIARLRATGVSGYIEPVPYD